MPARILVIDDDEGFREMLCEALSSQGHDAYGVGSAEEGVARAKAEVFDLVLTDVMLPGMDGLEGLSRLKDARPEADVIVMTGYATKEKALEAVRLGACDFFSKPFSLAEMEVVIRRVLERRALTRELRRLKSALADTRCPAIVGQSQGMRDVVDMVRRVAPLDSTVLITGESGAGKEVIADAIHALSLGRRRCASRSTARPFRKISWNRNCSAMSGERLPGRSPRKKASSSWPSTAPSCSTKSATCPCFSNPNSCGPWSRSRSNGWAVRGPSTSTSASWPPPTRTSKPWSPKKQFRADLFYRLGVATIHLPPLRERKEDLPLLAAHFLERINPRVGVNLRGVSREGMRLLFAYDWPGNVRQLANVLERAAIVSSGDVLTGDDIARALHGREPARPGNAAETAPDDRPPDDTGNLRETLQDMERTMIVAALKKAGGIQKDAARLLGVSPKNLWNKIQKHRIAVTDYSTASSVS